MKLSELKGVGPKTEELLISAGIKDVNDLLFYFPRDYETFSKPAAVCDMLYRPLAAVKGAFLQEPVQRKTGRLIITQAVFNDEAGGSIRAVWFNAPYMKNNIKTGVPYVLRGRVSRKYSVSQLDQPKIYSLAEYDELEGSMQPVYPGIKGVTAALLRKAVKNALESPAFARLDEEELIPEAVLKENNLIRRSSAVKYIHFPDDHETLASGIRRMAFEEIFEFIYRMKINTEAGEARNGPVIMDAPETEEFIKKLPYELTHSQKTVNSEISADMSSGRLMNRLIQGDVGSGKTIVALRALMNAAYSGYQSALMAPTEVLAQQHYNKISALFKENDIRLNLALLTGSMTVLEKEAVYSGLEKGTVDILIGTHALIREKVCFRNLGLVVTDEQHRFGTKQRRELVLKAGGQDPHVMVMSATPIPRTLALIIYGNMDVSVIEKAPSDRLPVKNAVVDDSWHEKAVRFIIEQVRKGHQAYVICPLVAYSEGLDCANVEDYAALLREEMPSDIRIGKLTGPMSSDQKQNVMKKFSEGQIDVLVSTTVVEVGVDVPNATVMMVEDADRFGLAALHQLRGRVGRSDAQSYCIFVSGSKNENSRKRLEILKASNDGSEIAAKDLQMRGPGEMTGLRQSGLLNFACFDLYRDQDIALAASEAVNRILSGETKLTDIEKNILYAKCASGQGRIML